MTKDNQILMDENKQTEFNFANALSVFEPHELACMYSEYLSDVDFVIEDEERLICLEYKNANVKNVKNPQSFQRKISEEAFWKKAAKKFYGTLFLIWACDRNPKEKPISYILLLEANPCMDGALKKRFTAKMLKQLPFSYENRSEIKRHVIDEFSCMDLESWNKKYPKYPIGEIKSEK